MILKTKSLRLQTTASDDAELKKLFPDFEILAAMSEKNINPVETPPEITFRIEKENILIGEIRLKNIKWYNRKSELGIMIVNAEQNKGFAGEALNKIVDYAFNTMNFYRLEAEVYDFNIPSKKLVEKSGFVYEGRLREAKYLNGKYHDILRYGLLKKEWL